MISAGHGGFCFDVRRDRQHNIHSVDGMKLLLENLFFLKPHQLCTIEPTCSSWLRFVSAGTSRRSEELCSVIVHVLAKQLSVQCFWAKRFQFMQTVRQKENYSA